MIRKIITDEAKNKLEFTETNSGILIEITKDEDIDFQDYSYINLDLNDLDFLISELKKMQQNLKK